MTQTNISLRFVVCASNVDVLTKRLLQSSCFVDRKHRLDVLFNAKSAADGFNPAMSGAIANGQTNQWLVWVHQDVVLPLDWDTQFVIALTRAMQLYPKLAVVGVYGIAGSGTQATRAGHVLDRGTLLRESTALPCLVDSLDELLFAVRVDSHLQLDAALGFDFYGTDLVLEAQKKGLQCAVVDAYCEHWSDTPLQGAMPSTLITRVMDSSREFKKKWASRLPVSTSCFELTRDSDLQW